MDRLDRADRQLIRDVAGVLAVPKRDPADSFVLHAALELLARSGLLALVPESGREAARERLRWLASAYEAAGDPVDPPQPVEPDAARLVRALGDGDLDTVDAQAVALAAVASPAELRSTLAGPIVSSLAAAAHGGILLNLLARENRHGDLPLGLARQALRELARHPSWQLRWFEDPDEPGVTASLENALLDVPFLGVPGSSFIYPLMNQAESSGVAPKLLRGIDDDAAAAECVLSRVAAWSMLQEPDEHVPYGWTHCLTMPQGTVRLADVAPYAVQVAATYVVGFRAAEGAVSLEPSRPVPAADDLGVLAAYAAAHEDAHLAKYVVASVDAATHDPAMRPLYLAAATRLADWWRSQPASAAQWRTG
jgi:hypothetical protein